MVYLIIFSPLILWVLIVAFYSVRRSTQVVERENAKNDWMLQPVLTHVQYEKYMPVQLHASVIVTDTTMLQFKGYVEEHMRHAVEDVVHKVLEGARKYVRIETNKDFGYGTELRASLDVYERKA